MIVEEVFPNRIKDLLSACQDQQEMVVRLIVEAQPGFRTSKLKILLGSKRWPHAVNPNLVVDRNSHDDKMARADAILDRLVTAGLPGSSFLDFGCGEGHATAAARRRGAAATGYDEAVAGGEGLTDDWGRVRGAAPFDVVLAYDVLDHSREEHPIDCLKRVREVMSPDGRLFLRLHPWCSRTGTHAYTGLNKAYLHYFFTQAEMAEMGAPGVWTRKVTHPIVTYADWVLKSGFQKVSENVQRERPEPFWEEEPLLRSVIQDHWKDSYEESLADGSRFPTYQMEQQFYDLVLTPKK